MAKKSVIEKIKQGIGLEDADVRKYVEDKKAKQDARLETYAKVNDLMKHLGDVPEKPAK